MTSRKISLAIVSCILSFTSFGCVYYPPHLQESPISRDQATMIAAANVPPDVMRRAAVSTDWRENLWVIWVFFSANNTVTRYELGWVETPDTTFIHFGTDLPENTYLLLAIEINRTTGALVSRQASDGIIVGPGTSPPSLYVPGWLAIASGITGLVVGGGTMWLILHRRKNKKSHQYNTNP